MAVNTSFNDDETIVCSLPDAVRCFVNTELDALLLGVLWVEQRRSSAVLS